MKSFFVVFVAVLMLIAITSCGEQAPTYYTVTFYNLGDVGPEGVYVHHILEGTNLTPRDPGVIAEHVYFDAEKTEKASLPIEVDRDLTLYIEWVIAE